MLIPLGILAGKNPIKATGGDIVISGGYVYHTFKASGTFAPTTTITNAEYLAIGGGGGSDTGGGGAGGYQLATGQTFSSTINIIIGSGGGGGSNGSNTRTDTGTIFAYGGATGSDIGAETVFGASGGGGSFDVPGVVNIGGGGNNGGDGYTTSGAQIVVGGGGGGAGAAGGTPNVGSKISGNGGIGTLNSTWATATSTGVSGYYAGGGAGGYLQTGWTFGTAGAGGGGRNSNGTANTGGGGGAGFGDFYSGGSGLMIIRYAA